MSYRERLQEAIALFEAGRKYSKSGTIKINLNEDGYDVVLSALREKLETPRWTLCAEGLPKAQMRYELLRKPKEYIVDMVYEGSDEHIVTTLGYGDIYDLCGYVEGYKAVWVRLVEYTSVGEGYTVLAWQPLPQPWTGEKKGV